MAGQVTCTGCKTQSPPGNRDHTLVTTQGWRVSHEKDPQGGYITTWWCASCWPARRAAMKQKLLADASRRTDREK